MEETWGEDAKEFFVSGKHRNFQRIVSVSRRRIETPFIFESARGTATPLRFQTSDLAFTKLPSIGASRWTPGILTALPILPNPTMETINPP